MDSFDELSRDDLISLIQQLSQRLAQLEQENEMLRAQLQGRGPGNALPPFVKPNRKDRREQERKERKKRSQPFARKREKPTEEIRHALDACPDCGRKLTGGWEHARRQVFELPETPVRIIDHVLIARRCGICRKVHLPKLGEPQGVIGKHRVGPRLMSWIVTLVTRCQMPREKVQGLLHSVYGLRLSVGEITEILHVVAERGKSAVADILEEIRQAPWGHADETGWREDGLNGYLWSFSTPTARYFHHDRSRGSKVAKEILGKFAGVLVADFYSGYTWYPGPLQRCWVHFGRDLKALRDTHQEEETVASWVTSVFQVYNKAKEVAAQGLPPAKRRAWRIHFEGALLDIARPYLQEKEAPQHGLANRIKRFQSELFTFVQHPGVPSENNAAERAIRPAVTARKVSGGTRSAKGSVTKARLMTLFGTWALRGMDGFQTCLAMLIAPRTVARAGPA